MRLPAFLPVALLLASTAADAQPTDPLKLFLWERGVGFEAPEQADMRVYLWFYEWNMFGARKPGEHTGGSYENPKQLRDDSKTSIIGPDDLQLTVEESGEMRLKVVNRSGHDWPELAGVIPCFNPGPEDERNPEFANTKTYFYGADGLERTIKREIHFSQRLRPLLDRISPVGEFVFSHKWPTSDRDARGGVIIRESNDGKWVTAVAWEDFLSAQAHNPWECMHLCVRVGPLRQDEERAIRGKVYLFQGTKEDALQQYLDDFGE